MPGAAAILPPVGWEREGRIYVRDIVELVIMLHEPTSFLIARELRHGTAGRDLTYELAEQAAGESNGR